MTYIRLKVLGLVFYLVATLVITAKIPSVDRLIATEKDSITKFEYHRIIAAMSSLQARHIAAQKRLYLMEANIAVYTNQGRARQAELRQRALDQDINEIRSWNVLFSTGEESELFQKAEQEIQVIIQNEELTVEQKIGEVETLASSALDEANDRLIAAQENRDEHIKKQEEFEKSRLFWHRLFLGLQILGIIFLTSSEVVDKWKSLRKQSN